MDERRGGMIVVALALFTASCRSDGGPPVAPPADAAATMPAPLDALDGIDLDRALSVGCEVWSVLGPSRDHAAVNDAVYDFLDESSDSAAVDAAVARACGESAGDPAAAIRIVMHDLGIDDARLAVLLTDACTRYRASRPFSVGGFDANTAMVLGVDDAQLTDLVDGICGR